MNTFADHTSAAHTGQVHIKKTKCSNAVISACERSKCCRPRWDILLISFSRRRALCLYQRSRSEERGEVGGGGGSGGRGKFSLW